MSGQSLETKRAHGERGTSLVVEALLSLLVCALFSSNLMNLGAESVSNILHFYDFFNRNENTSWRYLLCGFTKNKIYRVRNGNKEPQNDKLLLLYFTLLL